MQVTLAFAYALFGCMSSSGCPVFDSQVWHFPEIHGIPGQHGGTVDQGNCCNSKTPNG